ncbi:hypothetical protein B0183_11675 [Glaesserella parasuis]|uniref:hypothetical protein n=1 Tax=Glaesserella parasuis TaxID=738 RepID=UPI000993D216|nr:hypothetical protein [Glaesserella parasuis]OOR87542.1 hypothetical protein B0183_11675 [Glaesserella parasuis]STO80865.1 Uncharacterised protein [Glaesserella parasuis]
MKKIILAGFVSSLLVGCTPMLPQSQTTSPTNKDIPGKIITLEEARTKDYGAYPKNYVQLIKEHYNNTLKDPDSVKYKEITKPKKTANGITDTYYYYVCATINAKNSYGGYTGWTTDTFDIRDGRIISTLPYVPVLNGTPLTRARDENRCHTQAEILILNPR